ncbi:hypothetical protein, partial [Pseudomonas coronafaciens]|uniref:hypothetical protein n=1 Tax=Pseudomonas coronafaciens TaxID=53409 RepID=UPI001CC21F38
GRGLGNHNLPVGAVEKPASGGCPEAQIAYRGNFLPPSGKSGKRQFRGGSSLAGVQHEFDHSYAIDTDKRYETALTSARFGNGIKGTQSRFTSST